MIKYYDRIILLINILRYSVYINKMFLELLTKYYYQDGNRNHLIKR